MPICENKIKEQPIPSISEGDYNASEAAKIKRIREQAYFNSYDFDAIEVLPSTSSDDDDDNDIKIQPKNSHHNMSGKNRVITSMDNNSNLTNNNNNLIENHNNNYLKSSITKSSNYFKRFTSLFIPSSVVVKSINNNENDKQYGEDNENFVSDDIENQKNQINKNHQNSSTSNYSDNSDKNLIESDKKLYDNIRNSDRSELNRNSTILNGKQNSGFSLPRAILKSQSIGLTSNSMLSSSASVSSSSSSSAIINSGTTLNQFSSIERDQSQSQTYNKINTITIAADVIDHNDRNSFSNSSRSLNTENETIIRSSCRSSNCSCITTNCTCNDDHLLPQNLRNSRNQNNTSSFSSIATSIRSTPNINNTTNIPQIQQTTIAIINTPSCDPVSNQDQCKSISKNKNANLQTLNCYDKVTSVVSDRERGNILTTTSSSNYSTEKSGSSGYYSSNLCSSSSVEEHIYSEPVIDIIDTSRISSSSKLIKLRQGLINLQNDNQKNLKINLKIEPKQQQQQLQPQNHTNQQNDEMLKMNENLRILEKSIKNLDLHLKNYHPKLNIFDNQSRQQQVNLTPITTATAFVHYNGLSTLSDDYYATNPNNNGITKPYQLPTIMEGNDNQSTKKNKSWTDDIVDDSLMDIDLDSFLLVNEKKTKTKNVCGITTSGLVNSNNINGIDNPSFDKTAIFNEEALESNYKCSKYVNSCPEDAYKVESDLGTNVSNSIIRVNDLNQDNDNNSIRSNSIAFFLKKYEDQIHFQNTREMLEDIQDKIRNISVIAGANNNSDDNIHENKNHSVIPKELESNISVLKMELETYLKMMNRNSEMEIKQLCTGLVNNQKLVTLTKAFERRKSLTNSDNGVEYDVTYEPVRNLSKLYYHNNNSAINDINVLERNRSMTISNINYNNNNSKNNSLIRSKRDPNFQLKRKSLTDIFPINNNNNCNDIIYNCDFANLECETLAASKQNNNNFNIVTQLQRNLSFHRPILEKNDIKNIDKNIIIKDDKDLILIEQHKNKPSSWELYYGTNRINQTLTGKRGQLSKIGKNLMSYPSSRPESDFTLDLPRAEQLRLKMDKEKKFRHRCRILTTFLSLVFFLLTVMVVSLVLTRGKRMFGSML